jgi:DNA sulfur modification protein DndC
MDFEEKTIGEKLRHAQNELKEEYLSTLHNCPWIIGFSGGKDSTMLVHLVFEMLLELPPSDRVRQVIVLSNDTLVESPVLMKHLDLSLIRIKEGSEALGLPIKTVKTRPPIDQTFWVNLIGRGYPSPNHQFRWCTDRMKIQPTSTYILEEVSEFGEVILLLGVRTSESQTRAQTAAKYEGHGRLHPHSDLRGCLVFRPILDFTTQEVWLVLLQRPCPWGGSHRDLVTLYKNAEGGECPLIIDKSQAPSCGTGSSRFGCWTCTVVDKDKSMEGMIDSGFGHLEPLLEFRDWLHTIRNIRDHRQSERRNGEPGVGPYTFEARKMILEKLLVTQAQAGMSLISEAEVARIQDIWAEDTVRSANRLFEEFRKLKAEDEKHPTAF